MDSSLVLTFIGLALCTVVVFGNGCKAWGIHASNCGTLSGKIFIICWYAFLLVILWGGVWRLAHG